MGDGNNQWEDMGQVYSGAKDPLFFTYHANIDRMWEVYEVCISRAAGDTLSKVATRSKSRSICEFIDEES